MKNFEITRTLYAVETHAVFLLKVVFLEIKSLQVSLSLAYILRPSFGLQKFSRNQDKKMPT